MDTRPLNPVPESVPESNPDDAPETSAASPAEQPKPPKSPWKALLNLGIKLLVVAALLWAALTLVFGVFRLSGNNMYPMLKDGDLCITYRLEEYRSGDVVAYRADGEIRFGRIIARAGDTVDKDEQGLLINGSHPNEEIFYPTEVPDTVLSLPITLEEGEILVLNDYREDFSDSRRYGILEEEDLKGKVIFIFRRRGF